MLTYFLQRLISLPIVLLGVSVVTFALMGLAPGDPAEALLRSQGGEPLPEAVQALRSELRLDAPAPVRYVRWLGRVLQGDLGTSYRSRSPVAQELASRFPATLQLAVAAMLVALAIALPAGVLSAMRPNSRLDLVARLLALAGNAMPSFWLALLLIMLFAVTLRWLPAVGGGTPAHLVLPALALGLGVAARLTRLLRASLLEVLRADYMRTAYAKGLHERTAVTRHALKNALLPVVTVIGTSFGDLLSGAAIVETIFAWPGIGRYAITAIFLRDYQVIQGCVLYMATAFVLLNFLVDVCYRWLDPRLHFGSHEGAR
jgi:ABC-type dipeptide/oligopeptide/nickel transport system permease component